MAHAAAAVSGEGVEMASRISFVAPKTWNEEMSHFQEV